ncbi:unnamed protein product, partial [Symbiodinium microadriaticum]
ELAEVQAKERKEREKRLAEEKSRWEDEEEARNMARFKSYGQKKPAADDDVDKLATKPKAKKKKAVPKKAPAIVTPTPTPAAKESEVKENRPQEGETAGTVSAAAAPVNELEERMKRLEVLERSMKEKEERMLEAAKKAEERAAAMERALEMMEKRAAEEEAERAQRKQFLDMAAGPLSYRSQQSSGPMNSSRGPISARPPPSARSARDGTPRPKEALRVTANGADWTQLWDPAEKSWYWYCEASGAAQWEQPVDGYESSGALTDYSTDANDSGWNSSGAEQAGPWQEFWDDEAQAKYWYNNDTGEASWVPPDDWSQTSSSSAPINAGEWVSYIDDVTGQEYWYNNVTGESSWS